MAHPPHTTRQVPTALLFATGLLLLSLAVRGGWWQACDYWATQQAQRIGTRPLDYALFSFTLLGSVELTLIGWALIGWYLARRSRRAAVWFLGSFVAATLVELALKYRIPQAPIPAIFDRNPWHLHQHISTPYSFPSGHTLRTFYLGTTLAWLAGRGQPVAARRRLMTGLVVVLGLVAFSRVYLGDHWASDVIGGALLAGVALSWLRPHLDLLPSGGETA
ncbi:MAG: phosphatase PAP2 family protein [Candidatus Omnitrophica bacterium]|nr:phosphatase PAP2 family protein [Candidatus Omnitrophota bacterium]